MNLASTNIDTTELNRDIVQRIDNYPDLGAENDYFLHKDLVSVEKPTRCIDNFINNITVYNGNCP